VRAAVASKISRDAPATAVQVVNRDDPTPAPGQVLVTVMANSLNDHGVDRNWPLIVEVDAPHRMAKQDAVMVRETTAPRRATAPYRCRWTAPDLLR
jgi:hypothetical protein